jgi:hypothetical protein
MLGQGCVAARPRHHCARVRPPHRRPPPPPAPPPPAVRFGELPKVERKAITKVVNRSVTAGFDHTHICNGEIATMLQCFEAHAWDTAPCMAEIDTMHACVEVHRDDPDPKLLVRKWQTQMKRSALQHFAKAKVAARTLR